MRRVLKTWCKSNEDKLSYWQGLDSVSAPFILLSWEDEALAFSLLQSFVEKYLYNFFLNEKNIYLQQTLLVFKQLLAYHEPELYNHLEVKLQFKAGANVLVSILFNMS